MLVMLYLGAIAAPPYPVIESKLSGDGYGFLVPIEIEGKTHHAPFVLGYRNTVACKPLHKGQYTVHLPGGAKWDLRIDGEERSERGESIALGYSALRSGCVGIDLAKRTVSYWPLGIGGQAAAANWVMSTAGANWPEPTGTDKAALQMVGAGVPAIEATVKGKQALLRPVVDFGATSLSAFPEGFTGSPTSVHFGYSLALGGHSVGWICLDNVMGGKDPSRGTNYQGWLSPDAYCSRRVLYDFADQIVLFQHLSDEEHNTIFMNMLTRCAAEITDDGIVIDGPDLPEVLRPFVGATMTAIAGLSSRDIAKAIHTPSPGSANVLEQLYLKTRPAYEASVHLSEGRDEVYPVAADTTLPQHG